MKTRKKMKTKEHTKSKELKELNQPNEKVWSKKITKKLNYDVFFKPEQELPKDAKRHIIANFGCSWEEEIEHKDGIQFLRISKTVKINSNGSFRLNKHFNSGLVKKRDRYYVVTNNAWGVLSPANTFAFERLYPNVKTSWAFYNMGVTVSFMKKYKINSDKDLNNHFGVEKLDSSVVRLYTKVHNRVKDAKKFYNAVFTGINSILEKEKTTKELITNFNKDSSVNSLLELSSTPYSERISRHNHNMIMHIINTKYWDITKEEQLTEKAFLDAYTRWLQTGLSYIYSIERYLTKTEDENLEPQVLRIPSNEETLLTVRLLTKTDLYQVFDKGTDVLTVSNQYEIYRTLCSSYDFKKMNLEQLLFFATIDYYFKMRITRNN